MEKNKSKYLVFAFVLFIFLSFDNIYAKQEQKQICDPDGLYTITWNTEESPNFDPNKMPTGFYKWTKEELDKWYETTDKTELFKYEVTVTSSNCYQSSDGNYKSCPTNEDMNVPFNIITDVEEKDGSYIYKNIEMILDENTYKYTIKIKDPFDGKNVIRYVRNEKTKNSSLNMNNSIIQQYANEFISSKDGYFTITGIKPSTGVYLEVYVKNSSESACNGTFLGGSSFYTYNLENEIVKNPAYKNPNSYYCDVVKNDTVIDEEYKKKYIYECYDEKINYFEIEELYNTIKHKYEIATKIYNSFPEIIDNDVDNLNCKDGSIKTSKQTIKENGKYWSLNCQESFEIDPNGPKLVTAGGGFSYETRYTINRVCALTRTKLVVKKKQCAITEWCEVQHENDRISQQTDPTLGGPNEDFDECVQECDGGEYTQSCINKCYNQVYGEDNPNRKLSFTKTKVEPIPLLTNKNIKPKVQKTGVIYRGRVHRDDLTKTGRTYLDTNGAENKLQEYDEYEVTIDGINCVVGLGRWCSAATTYTTVAAYSGYGPTGCSENAEEEYKREIEKSKEEFARFKDIQTSYENIEPGEFKIEIQDSYLKDSNGNSYVYEVSSLNNPKATVEENTTGKETGLETVQITNKYDNSVTYYQTVERSKTFTVNLPFAYIHKTTGEAVYGSKDDTNNIFSVNLDTSKTFNRYSNFSKEDFYNGGYKYFTSQLSNNINVDVTDTGVTLQENPDFPNNIKVSASGVGTNDANVKSDFSSNMSCYYGVYNEFIVNGGIQYIYRPIDLENMFPDREARFNWTGTINSSNQATGAAVKESDSIYDDSIDPETLISKIQTKGESIYNVTTDSSEVDYEFVLTTENIRNIRRYNKNVRDYNGDGENNYLDYNMSCYRNNRGQEVCTSRFLDNTDSNTGSEGAASFITYSVGGFNIDSRKSIAGCNNAINHTECSDIGK